MESALHQLLADLRDADRYDQADGSLLEKHSAWLLSAEDDVVGDLLLALPLDIAQRGRAYRHLLVGVLRQLAHRPRGREHEPAAGLPAHVRRQVASLYRSWGDTFRERFRLLAWLAARGRGEDLLLLAELLADDPPQDSTDVAQVMTPLFQRNDYDPAELFPALLDTLSQVSVAATTLDLCNYLVRGGRLEPHPAGERVGELIGLLRNLNRRLAQLETALPQEPGDRSRLQRQAFESVALVISLCDALALMGARQAIDALHDVLERQHRRLRTEAGAALAALQDPAGVEMLAAMAAEPIERLRVLAYAEELELLDNVPPQYQSPVARAEAELALWLAQPAQFGFPPQHLELIDNLVQYWPGYEEPIACYLFRFTYQLSGGPYSNIGIAGPLTHAFRADLADLPPDDIYAAFAGWDAEHEEIYHKSVSELHPQELGDVARLKRRLQDEGFEDVRPELLGHFLGERVLVARATQDGQAGIAIIDPQGVQWRPAAVCSRPLGPGDWYCIYKGRRMLRSFNP